jgi:DNA-binding XRE family transcriptional regulator
MNFYKTFAIFYILLVIAVIAVGIYLLVLVIKALRKYISSKEVRREKAVIKRSLSEVLKENRIRCKMTQEFVSEAIGVSRQAVSKWENGTSEPSTSNLIALAQLYDVPAEELLKSVTTNCTQEKSEEASERNP